MRTVHSGGPECYGVRVKDVDFLGVMLSIVCKDE